MFPKQTQYTIKNTLDKCQGDLERATDELLNRVFLSEDLDEGTVRGVDGFDVGLSGKSVNSGNNGKKKRRNRKGKGTGTENHPPSDRHRAASLPNNDSGSVATQSRWDSMSHEVKHLALSLNLPEKNVQSVYHRHHGSLAPVLITLLETYSTPTVSLDPTHLNQLHELSSEFGTDVKIEHLTALLTLCRDNTAVFEFAEILRRASTKPTIKINTTSLYAAPPPRSAPIDGWITVGRSSASPSSSTSSPPTSPRSSARPLASLSVQTAARNEAFQKAADSYRKSRSNPLMGGAAAFYSELGHTHDHQVRSLRDEAAESLVNRNSSLNMLDLHGVTVPQAVRIAKERTTDWWVRQMRERELAGGGGGAGWGGKAVVPFNIVTGLGRHSKGGVPQLLPAVTRMLMKDGWKVVVEQGHLIVYGVKGR